MNFWIMRALSRDHYYAKQEGVYRNSGCVGFLGKVLFILVIVIILDKCGYVTSE